MSTLTHLHRLADRALGAVVLLERTRDPAGQFAPQQPPGMDAMTMRTAYAKQHNSQRQSLVKTAAIGATGLVAGGLAGKRIGQKIGTAIGRREGGHLAGQAWGKRTRTLVNREAEQTGAFRAIADKARAQNAVTAEVSADRGAHIDRLVKERDKAAREAEQLRRALAKRSGKKG